MTEDEAKGKWCPFARVAESGKAVAGFNRVQQSSGYEVRSPMASYCIGTGCMAWRWSESEDGPLKRATSADTAIAVLGTPEHRGANRASLLATRQGFCGLAGSQ
jgi:hypothetical protein